LGRTVKESEIEREGDIVRNRDRGREGEKERCEEIM